MLEAVLVALLVAGIGYTVGIEAGTVVIRVKAAAAVGGRGGGAR